MGDVEEPVLYPRYCFHLSPTWPVWCFFRAAEIHALDKHDGFEGEHFYFYKNLPIKWVRIVGLVVAVDDFAARRLYTIDDSSGACIEILETLSAPEKPKEEHAQFAAAKPLGDRTAVSKVSAYPDIDVGQVVEVKGGVSEFRGEKQINIEKMRLLRSTMEEVVLWEKRTKFRQEVLEQPWILSKREIHRAEKEAQKDEARSERKRAQVQTVRDRKQTNKGGQQRPQKQPLVQQPVNLREVLRDGKGKYGALGL